jgi:hypothetical protein
MLPSECIVIVAARHAIPVARRNAVHVRIAVARRLLDNAVGLTDVAALATRPLRRQAVATAAREREDRIGRQSRLH